MDTITARYLIVDGHQDLAWNILTFQRDYTRHVTETRRLEAATETPARNGDTLLGWPEYLRGNVGMIFGTLFAAPQRSALGDWDNQAYTSYEEAHQRYRTQLEVYHQLFKTRPDCFRLILDKASMSAHLADWQLALDQGADGYELPVGLVILMENAEGVRSPLELTEWWQMGVRIIGPAWTGTRYCGGTREPGPLTHEGYALLEAMSELGFLLDLSHMDEEAALQALDVYPGCILASHANAKSLLKGTDSNRHLSDRVIQGLLERKAVIGIVPANGFLMVDWKNRGGRDAVTLQHVAAQIDYICQMAGNAHHVAIGSDFDGGFGLQSVPGELDTIADLQKLAPILAEKGYSEESIIAILGQNWIDLLERSLP